MAMTINTNISSLNAQRNLGTSQSSLSTSMQRLSSGMRINSAKDDAAGLAIAERMGAQITGLNQAGRNANDGVSLAQTAEGALSSIGTNLQRIRELAVQSRNATNSTEDRAALQKEVDQLKSEIDRVATTTSFNGTKLLDGSFTSKAFQVGANQGERINIDSIQNAQIDAMGTWKSTSKPATALAQPLGGSLNTTPINSAPMTGATTADGKAAYSITVGGVEINVAATESGLATADAVAKDRDNLIAAVNSYSSVTGVSATANATAGVVSFTNVSDKSAVIKAPGTFADVTAAAATMHTSIPASSFTINTVNIGAIASAVTDTAFVDNTAKAINNAFTDGSVKATNENGKLVLRSAKDIVVGGTVTNTGLTAGTYNAVAGEEKTGFKGISVATAEGADDTILAMDAALKSVNSARADLGAIQNRFESVVSNLSVNSENLSASKSRIMDADFASETANLSRSQVLQQAGTAMVAQANQLPQGVLSLLR